MQSIQVPGKEWSVEVKLVTPELAMAMLSYLHEDQRRIRVQHMLGRKAKFMPKEKHGWTFPNSSCI